MNAVLRSINSQNIRSVPAPAADQNSIDYSNFKEFEFKLSGRKFAIKYVLEGTENYRLHRRTHSVQAGEYLLVPAHESGEGWIKSLHETRGICIGLPEKTVTDIACCMLKINDLNYSEMLQNPLLGDWLPSGKFNLHSGALGPGLMSLGRTIQSSPGAKPLQFSNDFFYRLGELFLADCRPFVRQMASAPALKLSTKKELYKRLLHAKEFMEDSFTQPVEIAEVARRAMMSEYQFFRYYKKVFGITPYRFMLQKRLEYGRVLLEKKKWSVSDVALETGFADLFSFSAAFKKYYGFAPSLLLKES